VEKKKKTYFGNPNNFHVNPNLTSIKYTLNCKIFITEFYPEQRIPQVVELKYLKPLQPYYPQTGQVILLPRDIHTLIAIHNILRAPAGHSFYFGFCCHL
jgi:hypothetical protein